MDASLRAPVPYACPCRLEAATVRTIFSVEHPRRRQSPHRAIAIARDVIEVLAIVAAGAWAIYTFVYEQRIKPAGEPPSILLTGSLQRIAERGGMVQMEWRATLRNTGHTRVYIIAEGFAAIGQRYTTNGTPFVSHPVPGVSQYDREARVFSFATIHRIEELTRYADPAYPSGYDIDPGEEIPYAGTFIVRKRDFDAVVLNGSLAYTKVDGIYPIRITYLPGGAIQFENAQNKPNFANLEVTLDRASLW